MTSFTDDTSPFGGKNASDPERSNSQGGCGPQCGCHESAVPTQNPSDQDEYKDKYLRLLAENENLRRRLQRESQEALRFATQKIILDLLDPFDNFEKALYHAGYSPSEDVRNWSIGFKMIHQQFKDWIHAQGVHSYLSKGQPFNAQLHEAVEVQATHEMPEGTVITELLKGYKIHDRILRPAKVIIAGRVDNFDEAVQAAETEISSSEIEALNRQSPSKDPT